MERSSLYPAGPGGDLTEAEYRLVRCAKTGALWQPDVPQGVAWVRDNFALNDPTEAEHWPAECRLRPEVIRCLVTGIPWESGASPWPLHSRGVLIANAIIDEDLDLEGCELLCQLWIYSSRIRGKINLQDATTKTLGFDGTHILQHKNAKPDDTSINGKRAHIDGQLFLRDGFHATCEVYFEGAVITGGVDCQGGVFDHPGWMTLNFKGAKIGGDVNLTGDFQAKGQVGFAHAIIAGSLYCDGGSFVCGNISDPDPTHFIPPEIDEKGHFSDVKTNALNLYAAKIGAGLHLTGVKEIRGHLNLEQAETQTLYDDASAWPKTDKPGDKFNGYIVLDGFTYQRRRTDLPNEKKTRWFEFGRKKALSQRIVDWLNRQPPLHLKTQFRPQPWVQAAKIIHEMGHILVARDIAYEREKARSRREDMRLGGRIWQWILGWAIGYGYKPFKAVRRSLFVIALGYLTFAAAGDLGYMAPREDAMTVYLADGGQNREADKPVPPHYTRFNALVYAIDTFLPGVELGQQTAWEPSVVRHGIFRKPVDPDHEGLGGCLVRLLAGKGTEWKPSSGSFVPICGHNVNISQLNAAGKFLETKVFDNGVHRFVYWIEIVFGWFLVSLFVAYARRILGLEE